MEPREKITKRYMDKENETGRKLVKYLIDLASKNRPDLVSPESIKKVQIGDKVLIFSDVNFQLLVATITKVSCKAKMILKSDKVFCMRIDEFIEKPVQNFNTRRAHCFKSLKNSRLHAQITEDQFEKSHLLIKSDGKEDIQFWFPDDDNYAILPISWSEEQSINVDFGEGFQSDSAFNEYFQKTRARAAPIELLNNNSKLKEFQVNTKLEVVHPRNPNQVS